MNSGRNGLRAAREQRRMQVGQGTAGACPAARVPDAWPWVGSQRLIQPGTQHELLCLGEIMTAYFTGLLEDKVETCGPAVEKRK